MSSWESLKQAMSGSFLVEKREVVMVVLGFRVCGDCSFVVQVFQGLCRGVARFVKSIVVCKVCIA